MTWKKVNNSDAGTVTKFGGNDLDKVSDAFNGVDVSDPFNFSVDINTLKATTNTLGDILKSNGTKYQRFPKGTALQQLRTNAAGTDLEWATITAGTGDVTNAANVGAGSGQIFRDKTTTTLNLKSLVAGSGVTLTNNTNDITIASTGGGGGGDVTGAANVGTGAGQVFKDETTGVLNFKRLLAGSNVTISNGTNDVTITSTATGGGASTVEAYTYILYRDTDNSYKARNGKTGVVEFTHADDAAEVILDIFDGVGAANPCYIKVAPGDYTLRSWSQSRSRRSNFTIEGAGIGLTNFLVNQEISSVAGQNNVFGFWASTSTYASNNLAADRSINGSSVSAATDTGLVPGAYVIISDDADGDKNGEVNRVVTVTGTGPYTIGLEKRTRDAYVTASAARIQRIDFLTNISLRDFTVKRDSNFTGGILFMSFRHADTINVDRVKLLDAQRGGFTVWLEVDSVINSRFRMEFEYPPEAGTFTNGWGYGISCRSACENCWFYPFFKGGIRHGFTTIGGVGNGEPRNIHVCDGNSDTTGEQSYDTHGHGDGIYFERCTVHSFRNAGAVGDTQDTSAFGARCKNVVFDGCRVVNNWGVAFGISADSPGSKVVNCYVRNIVDDPNMAIDVLAPNCQVMNNDIEMVDGSAIHVSAVADVQIVGNRINDVCETETLAAAIEVNAGATRIQINNNIINGTDNDAIRLLGATDCTVNGNIIANAEESGIKMTDSIDCIGTGNRIDSCDRGLEMTGTSNFLVWTSNNTSGNTNNNTTVGANNVIANNIGT